MKKGIYLDNSAATRPSDKAVSKMLPLYTDLWGSPSSPHQIGQAVFPTMEESYRALYNLLGAKENDTIIFTSSGTEAVNHAIFSVYYDFTRNTGRNHFVTSSIDEASALMSIHRLESFGCVSKLIPPNSQGIIRAQDVADTISPRTALVSLSWANGLTGTINPVSEIADLCRDRGILFHLDATHVLGKLFFELEDIRADFISFNGSALHAPQGTGALYFREGRKVSPFIVGGIEQGGYRSGCMNVAGLAALGEASKEALETRDYLCTEIARLRDKLEKGITEKYPEAQVFFKKQERVPHISAIGFPSIANEALLYALNRKGIFASIGGGNFQQIGLVLTACGVSESIAHSAISFSLSRETTEADIDKAIEIIVETATKLRQISDKIMPKF